VLDVQGEAGTAYDGTHLYQLTHGRIAKIEPSTGRIVSTMQAPIQGDDAGLTWAEGTLWMSQHRTRTITQIDPVTGEVLRTLHSDRFVTGVTFAEGELWHATMDGDYSELREIDTTTSEVRRRVCLPEGVTVSGLESNGRDLLYCGGGSSGRVRALRKPKRHH
jgi:glutamine cyclotransferase